MRRLIGAGILAAVATVTCGVMTPTSASADVSPSSVHITARPCGFSESPPYAYYRHCGSTTITIYVDFENGWSGYRCVGPWQTVILGVHQDIRFAGYWAVGCLA